MPRPESIIKSITDIKTSNFQVQIKQLQAENAFQVVTIAVLEKIRDAYEEYRKRAYEKYGEDSDRIRKLQGDNEKLKNSLNIAIDYLEGGHCGRTSAGKLQDVKRGRYPY